MRVCMMSTYDLAVPYGGVKHHVHQLAAALERGGDDVTVVGPSSRGALDNVHTFGGVVNVPANGSQNPVGIFVSPAAVARFFRANRFDVIHIHEPLLPSLSYWSVWLTRDVAHVATFHRFSETESRALGLARRATGKAIFPWFQRAIAVSEPAASYARLAWRGALSIIPNGVPTKIFTPSGERADDGVVRLLFVGHLGEPRKGARYLFEAYRALVERGVRVTLDVVGERGADEPPALPGLRYHGTVGLAELVELYRACDVFVAPATGQESFGIVLIEAMASGKVLVCSDIEGYRRVAIRDGAFLVPPGDARALEDALVRVVAMDPSARERCGDANRRGAAQYDWDVLAARVRGEYAAAIAVRREQRRAA